MFCSSVGYEPLILSERVGTRLSVRYIQSSILGATSRALFRSIELPSDPTHPGYPFIHGELSSLFSEQVLLSPQANKLSRTDTLTK